MKAKGFFAVLFGVLLALSSCAAQSGRDEATGPAASKPLESPAAPAEAAGAAKETPGSSGEIPGPGVLAGVGPDNYPYVDGSTANLPLMAALYGKICGVPPEQAETMVKASGTTDAWINLSSPLDKPYLLLVYEAPEHVMADLAEAGVNHDATPLGRDGLVFLVNRKNRVDSLTREQLLDIYTGKITDWAQVGGDPGEIRPFQRNPDSGSQTMFLKLLMKGVEPMEPPRELVRGFMGGLIDAVADYDGSGGALGYSVFYYASEMYANPELKLLKVDGVAPSAQTIGDGSYPLVNNFYAVIRKEEPADSPARLLRDWLLSQDGRTLLTEAGYVSARSPAGGG